MIAVVAPHFACASTEDGGRQPPRELEAFWSEYLEVPGAKAAAIAGSPQRNRWVIGAAGGQADRKAAIAAALQACAERRIEKRIQQQCVLFSVGPEIVWRGH